MPVCKTSLEIALYNALKRISKYETSERLQKYGEREYGVSGDECVAMAYDNVLSEAKAAIRNVRMVRALNPQFLLDQSNASEIHKREKEGG